MNGKDNSKVLATILIGAPEYRQQWERVVKPSWKAYGERHGYDIVAIDGFIDDSERGRSRSPNWQKCLILEVEDLRGYETVVWLDSDILINFLKAPCVATACPPGKIGLVGVRAYPERIFTGKPGDSFTSTGEMVEQAYDKAGLEPVSEWANTGLLVLDPERHAGALRHVYDNYEESEFSAKEELPLSHYLFGNDLAHPLDVRFNWPWSYFIHDRYPFLLTDTYRNDAEIAGLCVNAAWHDVWFMHFTSDLPSTRHHATLVVQWSDLAGAFQAIKAKLGS